MDATVLQRTENTQSEQRILIPRYTWVAQAGRKKEGKKEAQKTVVVNVEMGWAVEYPE